MASFWSNEYFYFRLPIEFSSPVYTSNRICYHPAAGNNTDAIGSQKSFTQERVWLVKQVSPGNFKTICSYTPCLNISVSAVGDTYYKEPYIPDPLFYSNNYGMTYVPIGYIETPGKMFGTTKTINPNTGIVRYTGEPGKSLVGIQKIPAQTVNAEIANLVKQNPNVNTIITGIAPTSMLSRVSSGAATVAKQVAANTTKAAIAANRVASNVANRVASNITRNNVAPTATAKVVGGGRRKTKKRKS
jgi:hypothetical protein